MNGDNIFRKIYPNWIQPDFLGPGNPFSSNEKVFSSMELEKNATVQAPETHFELHSGIPGPMAVRFFATVAWHLSVVALLLCGWKTESTMASGDSD